MNIVEGNLLETDCQIIVQQSNCLSVTAKGLALAISAKYPYADVYSKRRGIGTQNLAVPADRGIPGTNVWSVPEEEDGGEGPIVVGMYGQYNYGKFMKYMIEPAETKERRVVWFKECLAKLKEELESRGMNRDDVSIGFPYGIGCGLAGGDWKIYSKMLDDFAGEVKCNCKIFKMG